MLELREPQIAIVTLAPIVDQIARECEQALPRHHRALGTAGVRTAVAEAIAAAQRLGIELEDGWRAYVRLTFLFDREFDVRLPWARDALARTEQADGVVRINALIAAARAEIERRRLLRKG